MVPEESLVVLRGGRIDRIPAPPPPPRRGRPAVYSDCLFLKALVVLVLKRLPPVHALRAGLDHPPPAMRRPRLLLTEGDHFPCRRTWERRLATAPTTLPAQIACRGRYVVAVRDPWRDRGRAVAIASMVLPARGGVWRQKHRAVGIVPHSSMDTAAHSTKSGWHGGVSGWKLQLVVTGAGVWLPPRAVLPPANAAANEPAPALLTDRPTAGRFVRGDSHDHAAARHRLVNAADRSLVANRRGPYPHRAAGAEVRRIFPQSAAPRSSTSTVTARRSSPAAAQSPRAASPPPRAGCARRSSSTNSPCSCATRPPSIRAAGSNLASRPRRIYDQAS
ncbi:MAG: hypothetical protein ACRDJH_21965, partial [Thermomicrobiales bacterium]